MPLSGTAFQVRDPVSVTGYVAETRALLTMVPGPAG
jgi:hypothetical protein